MANEKTEVKKPIASTEMDLGLFEATQFKHRTQEIQVPSLKKFYPKNTIPIIIVRNLEGAEIAAIDLEVGMNKEARKQVADIASEDVVKAMKTLFHFISGDDVPDSHVRALNIVHKGIVSPAFTFEGVVKLATTYPIEFKQLFNTIIQLTGLGAIEEK